MVKYWKIIYPTGYTGYNSGLYNESAKNIQWIFNAYRVLKSATKSISFQLVSNLSNKSYFCASDIKLKGHENASQ